LQLINSQQPDKEYLDIGAGTGDLAVAKENGWKTVEWSRVIKQELLH
jgi:ribosomal protein L11 methylase PrmA